MYVVGTDVPCGVEGETAAFSFGVVSAFSGLQYTSLGHTQMAFTISSCQAFWEMVVPVMLEGSYG